MPFSHKHRFRQLVHAPPANAYLAVRGCRRGEKRGRAAAAESGPRGLCGRKALHVESKVPKQASRKHGSAGAAAAGRAGPLDVAVDAAGVDCSGHLQHRITEQIERAQRDQLSREMMQLPVRDTRRVAWASADRLSSQWVASWPTHDLELGAEEMPEVITTYLGRESPVPSGLMHTRRVVRNFEAECCSV